MRGVVSFMVALLVLPMAHQDVLADGSDEEQQQIFEWKAEEDFTGDLVVRLTFTPLTESRCTIEVAASGLRDLERPVHLYVRSPTFNFAFLNGHQVETHAQDLNLDTRELTSSTGHWANSLTSSSTFEGSQDLMIVASGLETWHNQISPGAPFQVIVTCDEGLTVHDLGGSLEVLGFTHQSMHGTGASIILGPGVQFHDHAEADFTSPEVVTAVSISGGRAALATLQHPGGNLTYLSLMDGPLEHTGGPGDYRFEITSAGSGSMIGTIAGVQPVDSLDQLLHP